MESNLEVKIREMTLTHIPVKIKVPEGKSPSALARGLGKVFKKKGKTEYTARVSVDDTLWIVTK